MDRFSSGRFNNDDPWFRIGDFGISTTILVVSMGVLSMFVWAIEGAGGPIFRNLYLVSRGSPVVFAGRDIPVLGVLEGGVWRLFTWPIPNEPDFWTIILFAVFFMLGSQLEGLMGRKNFTIFLLVLTVVPAVAVTLFELITNVSGAAGGLRFVELGVLIAFAANMPNARFWPGIPAWIIAVGIVVLETLQIVGARTLVGDSYQYSLLLLYSVVAVALLGIRAFGFADELAFIPKIPLPASLGGDPYRAANKKRERSAGSGSGARGGAPTKPRRGRANLRPVPPPMNPQDEALADMEIDALLDQVASDGLNSLTPAQRKRLESHSKRLRKRDD